MDSVTGGNPAVTEDAQQTSASEVTVNKPEPESVAAVTVPDASATAMPEPEISTATAPQDSVTEPEALQESLSVAAASSTAPEPDVEAISEPATEAEPEATATSEPAPTEEEPDQVAAPDYEAEIQRYEPEEKTDYANFSEAQLIKAMSDLIAIARDSDTDIRENVEQIKRCFSEKHKANVALELKKYLENGGDEADFVSELEVYEDDMKNLLREYRQMRGDVAKLQDEERDRNLQLRYELIEQIKGLVNSPKVSIPKTMKTFRELQQQWHDIGPVPTAKMKDLWDTYHHHVENFYDFLRIHRDLREIDLQKNAEAKQNIIKKTEELLNEPSVVKSFKTLQSYHEQWHEIGAVPLKYRTELWDQFRELTAKINKRHQDFFDNRKKEEKKHLEHRKQLCEKVEKLVEQMPETMSEWQTKMKQVLACQDEWRKIGVVSKRDEDRTYKRFRQATDKFFNARHDFLELHKELFAESLNQKLEICKKAEAIQDSVDWAKTTAEFLALQKAWKETASLPKKQSDHLWRRFRAACDAFFNRKEKEMPAEQVADKSAFIASLNKNLEDKLALQQEIEQCTPSDNAADNENIVRGFHRKWHSIGQVPRRVQDEVNRNFREAINGLTARMNFDEKTLDRLTQQLSQAPRDNRRRGEPRDARKDARRDRGGNNNIMTRYSEKERLRYGLGCQLERMETELAQLKNNIGFFANTESTQSLIESVNKKISETEVSVQELREKIIAMDAADAADAAAAKTAQPAKTGRQGRQEKTGKARKTGKDRNADDNTNSQS